MAGSGPPALRKRAETMSTTKNWTTGVSGNFNNSAAWTPNGAPTASNQAIIDATGTYTVTSNVSTTINSLALISTATLAISGVGVLFDVIDGTQGVAGEANAGTITVGNGATFEVGANFTNAGAIKLNSTGAATGLELAGSVALNGGGALTLSNSAANSIFSNGSPATLTNVDNRISGAGQIGDANLSFVNQASGLVNATGTVALVLNTGANTIINNGTLEDTGAGGLQIRSTVNNATVAGAIGGVIEAVGATTHVDLNGATIIGGTLTTAGGGQIDTTAGTFTSELDGLSGIGSFLISAGKFVVTNNSGLKIQGDIHNVGSIALAASGAAPARTQLLLAGDTTLDGGGTLTLSNNVTNSIVTTGGVATLTNIDNTISGAGTIGSSNNLTFVNQAIVNATATNALVLNTGTNAIVNSGLIETTGTGGATISSDVTNTGELAAFGTGGLVISKTVTGGAVVAIDAGSHIDLKGGTISGSVVKITAGAALDTVAGTNGTLAATAVDNSGAIAIANGTTLTAQGPITNTGKLTLNASTAATTLSLSDDLTLKGGGQVILSNNLNNSIGAAAPTTLENVDNTISGAGTIGDPNMSLLNDLAGVINANGSAALAIGAGFFANSGMLKSTGAGGLFVNTSLTNTGTVNAAGAGGVFIGALTNAGLVETTGAGTLEINGQSNALAIANTGAIDAAGSKGILILSATIDNTSGSIGALTANSSVTLQVSTIEHGSLMTLAGGSLATAANSVDTIASASINNAGSIALANGSTLILDSDTVFDHGTIALKGSATATSLEIANSVTLEGAGQVTLANNTFNSIISNGSPASLANINDTIAGAGTIGDASLTFDNGGTINANGTAGLTLAAGAFVNTGTIKTTGTGGLLVSTAIDNSGGTIAAAGTGAITVESDINQGLVETQIAGANVVLKNGSLTDGTVSTVAGSTITVLALTSDTIEGIVNNLGTIAVADNSSLTVAGQFNNTGAIQLNSTNDATALEIHISATLSGGGKLTLTNNTNNSIVSDGNPANLTNVNNTISGAGTIGDANLTLVNDGTISATGTGANKLIIDTGPQTIVNNGKISDAASAGLTIESNVTNTGSITASGAGALLIDDATVTGGIISALAAGSHIDLGAGQLEQANISTVAGSMIDTVTATTGNEIKGVISNAGSIVVTNNSQLTLSGPVTNTGAISLNASSTATMLAINNVVLTGHGKVTLTDNAANLINSGASASNPATASVTVGGAADAGDTVSLTFTNSTVNGGQPVTVSYVVQRGDQVGAVAAGLINAIDNDSTLTGAGITATSGGTGVISVSQPGAAGNATVISGGVSGSLEATIGGAQQAGDVVTLTFGNGAFANLPDSVSYTVTNTDTASSIAAALAATINGNTALAADHITAGSSGANITVNETGAVGGETTLNSTVSGTVTATVSAPTPNVGDTVSLTFTNSNLGNNQVTITYTIGATDTQTSITSGLIALINGDTDLAAAGLTASATATGNVFNLIDTGTSQAQTTITQSESGTESITLSSANTTTDTVTLPTPPTLIGETLNFGNGGSLSGGGSAFTNIDNTISGAGTIGDASMTLTNSVNGIINANGTNALHLNAGLLVNSGLIESTKAGGLVIGAGNDVVNNGTIAALVGVIDVKSALSGTGTAKISGSAQIKFEAANTHQNVVFAAGTIEELFLTNSQTFSGNISGFTGSESIDLQDINFAAGTTTATYTANSNLGGTLVITDGTHTTDLSMVGTYSQASFSLQNDGNGKTLLLDPPVDTANHTIAGGATETIAKAGLGTDTFSGKGGTLVLDLASDFAGKISGFGGQDRLDLADIGFGAKTTLGYSANGNGGGTLTVSDAGHIAKIALLGNYMASSFAAASDGHGGTFLEAAASTPAQNALALPHA
jgi:hypothetical protein